MHEVKVQVEGFAGNNALRISRVSEASPNRGIEIDDGLMVESVSVSLVPEDLRAPNSVFWLVMSDGWTPKSVRRA